MRSFKSISAKLLANQVTLRRLPKKNPLVLWLGNGASIGAKIDSWDTMKRKLAIQIGERDVSPEYLLSRLSDYHLTLLLNNAIKSAESTLGHVLLAELCAQGYFQVVITTNWDYLVETSLRRVIPPDRLRILNRPLHSDELICRQLRDLDPETVVLIRLHGSFESRKIIAKGELLKFEPELHSQLRELIESRGILFAGYTCGEPRLEELCGRACSTESVWVAKPTKLDAELATKLGVDSNRMISSKDGEFENLMQGLCMRCLQSALSHRSLVTEPQGSDTSVPPALWRPDFTEFESSIESIIEGITNWIDRSQMDDDEARGLTKSLVKHIVNYVKDNCPGGMSRTCIFYIDNSRSPGGSEIRSIIQNTKFLPDGLDGAQQTRLQMIEKSGSHGNSIKISTERNIDYSRVSTCILVDDVSFSGTTLRNVNRWIRQRITQPDCQFAAALLKVTKEAFEKLTDTNVANPDLLFHVMRADRKWFDGVGLITPWGYIRPTIPILSTPLSFSNRRVRDDEKLSVDDFKPSPAIGLVPKPWGEVHVVLDNTTMSTRTLLLNRGERTSLHYHLLRDETFYVLDDRVRIGLWDRFVELRRYQSMRIPRGVPHILIALDTPCRIVEIAEGFCDARFDIVRLADIHARKAGPYGPDGVYT